MSGTDYAEHFTGQFQSQFTGYTIDVCLFGPKKLNTESVSKSSVSEKAPLILYLQIRKLKKKRRERGKKPGIFTPNRAKTDSMKPEFQTRNIHFPS